MRRIVLVTSIALLAGCGGGSSPIGPSAPNSTPTPTAAPTLGPLDVSTTDLQFTSITGSDATMTFTVSQSTPAAGLISVVETTCAEGASLSFTPSSVSSNTTSTISVTAISPPSGTPTHACTLLITGSSGASATVYIDIRTASATLG